LKLHGKYIARALETSEPAQARGQKVHPSFAGKKIRGEGACTPGRPALSQPRGQHAHGSEENAQGESFKEEIRKEVAQAQNCKEEGYKKESRKVVAQAPRIRT
jgi:hypothetical protein